MTDEVVAQPASDSSPDLKFPPLLNGLDYLEDVVDRLADNPGSRDLKYAVLHLQAAVEVLLKVRLTREHWTLVFRDVDKAEMGKLESGDFTSISLDEAVSRLERIAGVSLTTATVTSFSRLSKLRNRLQHHGLTDSAKAVEALTSEVLEGLATFLRRELSTNGQCAEDDEAVRATLEVLDTEIHRLHGVLEARLSAITPELTAAAGRVILCLNCHYKTLVIDGKNECLLCRLRWDNPSELAGEHASGGFDEDGVIDCIYCDAHAMASDVVIAGIEPPVWACFDCGETVESFRLQRCSRCARHMLDDGESVTCSTCWEEITSTD